MTTHRILIIDDEEGIRKSIAAILRDENFKVDTASSGEEGLKMIARQKYSVALLDIWLPGIDGVETLQKIKETDSDIQVVIISGHGNVETAVKTTKLGAFDFIEKPPDLEKTVIIIRNAIKHRQLSREIRIIRENKEKEADRYVMIGQSDAMERLKKQIERAAPSEGRVLIFGENGTGKELAARMIHKLSSRSLKPFVEVNCAAIPDDLIESELFGHKKGSFTGADKDKIGKFEQADGGTLFLDEIGDMSYKTQAKVLRALEAGTIQPVGDVRTISVDVRVITATNKNLDEEIKRGKFRQDLFFRLNVLPINIPPLRERLEDIQSLVEHFQSFFSSRYGIKKKDFTPEALILFSKYNWPGNIRELRNIIERIFIMHSDTRVDHQTLNFLLQPESDEKNEMFTTTGTLKDAMESFEKKIILYHLRQNGFSMGKTANNLGIERTSLYRKLKKYEINGAIDEK